jgi:hypothetical protein
MRIQRILIHLAAALLLLAGIPTMAQKKTTAAPGHPEVEASESCHDCHESVTPDITARWRASAHGVNGVLCVVCHGGLENFSKTPDEARCAGCHAAQTESMGSEIMRGKTCITCHPAHQLLPHAELPSSDPGVADKATEGGTQ